MSACGGGHLAVAQLLLDAGASVGAAADDGFTALMEARHVTDVGYCGMAWSYSFCFAGLHWWPC